MKEMSKARIITKRSVKSVINERQILEQLNNTFIVNMYYAFQDRENLYLVMDYLSGGDLRYHICRYRRFDEETTKFFVACLVQGLEYIHEKNIIHRDIKPENLVIENDGKRFISLNFRLYSHYRLRNCSRVERRQCAGYLRHTRIHGAGGHVSTEPHDISRPFCSWCDGLRVHVR